MDRLSAGCFGRGIITSSASEGVKDGSASKIGVVSGEAIWSKSATTKVLVETRSYRPQTIPRGLTVSFRPLGREFDSRHGGRFFPL
jgi:hypothetical protein